MPDSYRIDLERSILGILIWDAEAFVATAGKIDDKSFEIPQLAVIYRRMAAMVDQGQALTPVAVISELKRLDEIKAAGGDEFVAALSVEPGADFRRLPSLIEQLQAEIHRAKSINDFRKLVERGADRSQDMATVLADALNRVTDRSDEIVDKAQRLPVMTLDEILSTAPDPDAWLIRGILPQQGVIVLAGLPKQGKTLLVQQMGLSVAGNQEIFDREVIKSGPVVMVGLEGSRNSFLNRIQAQCKGMGLGQGLPFHLITRPKRELLKINGPLWHELEAVCTAVKPVLVIIDPLTWISDSDENNNDEMSRLVMLPLQQFAVRHDCLLLVVHHMKKPSAEEKAPDAGDFVGNLATKIRGASAIIGGSDGNFAFELLMGKGGLQNTQTYRLSADLRDGPGFISYLRRDPTSLLCELTVSPNEQAKETYVSQDPQIKLLQWFAANASTKADAKTIGEFANEKVGLGYSWSTANKHIKTAVANGTLEAFKDGSWWRFYLSASAVVPQAPIPTLTNGTPVDQAPKTHVGLGLTPDQFDAHPVGHTSPAHISAAELAEDPLFD